MMLDYILLEVVMYSANNLQVTSELVLASLSSCYQTASKFIFSQKVKSHFSQKVKSHSANINVVFIFLYHLNLVLAEKK